MSDKKDVREAKQVYERYVGGKASLGDVGAAQRNLSPEHRADLEKRKTEICHRGRR